MTALLKIVAQQDGFAADLLSGLRRHPRSVPPKYFYDAAGSALFDRICALDEYYPTRTEIGLLARYGREMAECIGPEAHIVEFGAGSLQKIRILLDSLIRPARFIPVDISADHLHAHAVALAEDHPLLQITPIAADFTQPMHWPDAAEKVRRVGFFPGSSIGNFTPDEAATFLRRAARLLRGGGLLIGVDLVKDPAILHRAYNDALGVTAAFNKNLLVRANRELGATFDVDAFDHYAFYEPVRQRVEMHLVSRRAQAVRVAGERFLFEAGDSVHTENSCKYTVAGFRRLAEQAGFRAGEVWCDDAALFSVHWLRAPEE